MEKIAIFLAGPHHDNRVSVGAGKGFWLASQRHRVIYKTEGSSLLARNFNLLWAQALDARDAGQCTHFAMLHSDIEPEPWWLDRLMDEYRRYSADVLAAVVPIKSLHGLTSTAIDNLADPWSVERRLTMHEVMRLPETFGVGDVVPGGGGYLLVNTGLFLCDLRLPWCDDVHFTIQDRITWGASPDGRLRRLVQCIPEDWRFSREVQRAGGTVMATRCVSLVHHGVLGYSNGHAWGEWQFDQEYASGPLGAEKAAAEEAP